MAKVVLLHGTLQGVPIFYKTASLNTKYGGFSGWKALLNSGDAVFLPWGISKPLTFFQQLNPKSYIDIYFQEKNLAHSKQTLRKLHDFLLLQYPEIIVCHSRGADYFLQYVNNFPLGKSVKKIVFVMGGVQRDFQITNLDVLQRIKNKKLVWINYFCPWDNVLPFTSLFLNKKIAAGLFGTSNPYVVNRFFLLYMSFNPHMKVINDKRFIDEILHGYF